MTKPRTIADVLDKLRSPNISELPPPTYSPRIYLNRKIFMAVESMSRHTADAGWQLTLGLQSAGYTLCGHDLSINHIDVPTIISMTVPDIAVIQDKREWEGKTAGNKGPFDERFKHVDYLKDRDDLFRLTVLKDAHQRPHYHKESSGEIGCHAWITYYHPKIVKHVAPFVRTKHLVRTYHTVDSEVIPDFDINYREGAILSGAISGHYPLRRQLVAKQHLLQHTDVHRHPGYQRMRCHTPHYLNLLSRYKVSICTTSKYGYSLRKIIESTACGCRVVTDLPVDDVLPQIDDNLIRVDKDATVREISMKVKEAIDTYNPEEQEYRAYRAKMFYDWRNSALRLDRDIREMRDQYND